MEQKAAVAEIDRCGSTLQQAGKVSHRSFPKNHKQYLLIHSRQFSRGLVVADQCPSMAYSLWLLEREMGHQINTVPRRAPS